MIRRSAVLVVCALVLPVPVARAWTWPVNGPVLRPFSFDRAHPYAAGQHRGVDLGAASGTDVRAPASGIVSFAGTVPGGGKTVSLETPSGYTATLLHLGSIGVQRGAQVNEGAVVGSVGPSGRVETAEPFVYFGLRKTADDQGYVDPLSFLPVRSAQSPAPAAVDEPAQQGVATAAVSPAAPAAAALPSAPADAVSADAPEALTDVSGVEIEGSGRLDAPRPVTQTPRAPVPHGARHLRGAVVSRPKALQRSSSPRARSLGPRDVSQRTHRRGAERPLAPRPLSDVAPSSRSRRAIE